MWGRVDLWTWLTVSRTLQGHRVNQDRVATRLNPTGDRTSPKEVMTALHAAGLAQNHTLSFFVPTGFDPVEQALKATPDPQRALFLVHFYFAKLEWYTKVCFTIRPWMRRADLPCCQTLHAPSFLVEVRTSTSCRPYPADVVWHRHKHC
mgnify:CR=1 FL=1